MTVVETQDIIVSKRFVYSLSLKLGGNGAHFKTRRLAARVIIKSQFTARDYLLVWQDSSSSEITNYLSQHNQNMKSLRN